MSLNGQSSIFDAADMGCIEEKGLIFDIERFATEDGPGIRTVVFLKGCGLRCQWCANPESQRAAPEIMWIPSGCRMCEACLNACQAKAILPDEEFGLKIDTKKCIGCGGCVQACVYDARKISGKWYTVDEVIEILLRDVQYYRQSGGGITFSGGEPLLQAGFIRETAIRLKKEGLPTLIETCGAVPWEAFKNVIPVTDIIFFDIKHIDNRLHEKITGSGNKQIIENLRRLDKTFGGELYIRYPYIPGYNDEPAHIREFLEFCEGFQNVKKILFLPYHRLGLSKYKGLGRPYMLKNVDTLSKKDLLPILDMAKGFNLNIEIGG